MTFASSQFRFINCIFNCSLNSSTKKCYMAVTDGVKYSLEDDGVRIHYIEPSDSGVYECRAEVESQGNLKVQTISVDVLCKCKLVYTCLYKKEI